MSRIVTPEPTIPLPPTTLGERICQALLTAGIFVVMVIGGRIAEALRLTDKEPPADSYE
jgi:hypothetical protein